ncbi:hypothetical protein PM082_021921 [Marasmius tenuissimus]|nr:hypothetical protein PM082_021921 [Marasmius tenuissimus]
MSASVVVKESINNRRVNNTSIKCITCFSPISFLGLGEQGFILPVGEGSMFGEASCSLENPRGPKEASI